LKINTVINSTNFSEDIKDFIRFANPERWKVMQVLPIKGQNDTNIEEFIISKDEFNFFIENHREFSEIMVTETNTEIMGSYVMIDPAGRFFCNSEGTHNYSQPILEVGVDSAISKMNYDVKKFLNRGGLYNWSK